MTDHEQYIPPEEQQVSIIVKQGTSDPYSSNTPYIKTERDNPEPDLIYSGELRQFVRKNNLRLEYGQYILPQFDESRSFSAVY